MGNAVTEGTVSDLDRAESDADDLVDDELLVEEMIQAPTALHPSRSTPVVPTGCIRRWRCDRSRSALSPTTTETGA
jgi:hypothetical protein